MIRVHASAINAFRLCPRRVWFRQREGEGEDTPALRLGTEVHRILESILRDRGTPDDAEIDALAVVEQHGWSLAKHMSDHAAEVQATEWEFSFEHDGVPFQGTVDAIVRTKEGVYVVDHKTSSHPQRHGETAASLGRNPQAIVYSHAVSKEWGTVQGVWWNYLPTRGGKPAVVEAVADPIDTLLPEARAIRSLPLMDVADVPKNPSACSAYRRACPYLHICPITSEKVDFDRQEPDVSKWAEEIKRARERARASLADVASSDVNPKDNYEEKEREAIVAESVAAESVAAEVAVESVAAEIVADPAAEPKKRGRPKGSRKKAGPTKVLYVGCMPTDGSANDAWPVVQRAAKAAALGAGVEHYKQAKFGAGPGLLVLAAERELAKSNTEAYYISDPMAGPCADALPAFVAWADLRVVRT